MLALDAIVPAVKSKGTVTGSLRNNFLFNYGVKSGRKGKYWLLCSNSHSQ